MENFLDSCSAGLESPLEGCCFMEGGKTKGSGVVYFNISDSNYGHFGDILFVLDS